MDALAGADLVGVSSVQAGLAVAAAATVAAAAVGVGAEVEAALAVLAVVAVEQEDHAQAFSAEKLLWASQQLFLLCTSIGPRPSLGVTPTYRRAARP
jgi:hypothetical protein